MILPVAKVLPVVKAIPTKYSPSVRVVKRFPKARLGVITLHSVMIFGYFAHGEYAYITLHALELFQTFVESFEHSLKTVENELGLEPGTE